MWAVFTGCGKRGKWLGGSAGWDNWEEWLRGDFNAEFAETREEKDGMMGLSGTDGSGDGATSIKHGTMEYTICQVLC